jgi:ABC-type amino acid transport substrate-binding protein
MRLVIFVLCAVFLSGCGCGKKSSDDGTFRLGVDPNWYPINFGAQQAYVNGFTEDFLIELSKQSGLVVTKVTANWDALLEGLTQGKYDAVLTSLPRYTYNEAKYDFSDNFLDIGPVFILREGAQDVELSQMKGGVVGFLTGDPSEFIIQKNLAITMRSYASIPDLLNDVANGVIEAAVLSRIPAVNYVSDLYAGKLKMASAPLTEAGLHLVTLKQRQEKPMKVFDKGLSHLKKKGKLSELLKKWGLD